MWTISKEAINALPTTRYEGPAKVVSRPAEVAAACERLAREEILGFDTETRPSFRVGEVHPVALLQLAAADRVYLFQLGKLDDLGPLREILEAPAIVKAGVGLVDDLRGLQRRFALRPANFCELGRLPRSHPVRTTGLRSLCAMFLGVRLPKTAQTSDWSRAELTPTQIDYAATDAWVSRLLYLQWLRGEPPLHGVLEEPRGRPGEPKE